MSELSEAEASALRWLREARSTLISYIPDKPATDAFGDSVPHMAVFRRLEKKRLCFQTLEDPVRFTNDPNEDPFHFTPSFEFTERGLELVKNLLKRSRVS